MKYKPIKLILGKIPMKKRSQLFGVANKTIFGRQMLNWYRQNVVDAYLLSFPKCGRTWLRLMLGKAISLYSGVSEKNLLEFDKMAASSSKVPWIRVDHDSGVFAKSPEELSMNRKKYVDKKVILLIRDPRDVIVSLYFQATKRRIKRNFEGDISSFLRQEKGSLDTLIAWYNMWAENRNIPSKLQLVRYEEMHNNAEGELRKILDFVDLQAIDDEVVKTAVEYSRFENMRNLETNDKLGSHRLRPGKVGDVDSYKVRKGKVGGYVESLNSSDVEYIDQKINRDLSDFYSCYKSKEM